jgi:hypothetical protein
MEPLRLEDLPKDVRAAFEQRAEAEGKTTAEYVVGLIRRDLEVKRVGAVVGWAAVCGMLLLAVGYLVVVPLGLVPREDRLATPEIVLGVALIAAIAFSVQREYDLSGLSVGSAGVTVRVVKRLQKDQAKLASTVSELTDEVTDLFLLTMAPSMFNNLAKLKNGFGEYTMSDGLKRELLYLRESGYIKDFAPETIPRQGPNLNAHITITPEGERFVKLRQAADRRNTSGAAAQQRR